MMFDLAELQAAAAATEGTECSTEEGTARVQTKSTAWVQSVGTFWVQSEGTAWIQSEALHKLHIALGIAVHKMYKALEYNRQMALLRQMYTRYSILQYDLYISHDQHRSTFYISPSD